jgi:nickel/cobalt exporter
VQWGYPCADIHLSLGLPQTGVIAVFAMLIGTAITVSALAILTIVARSWAQRLITSMPDGAGRLSFGGSVASFIGGLLIVVLGASLINATLVTANHPLM